MSETALTVAPGRAIMPVMNIQEAATRRQAIVDFTRAIMVPGKDYGTVPGTGDKPTLLKPGAEKLTTLFGLSPRFEIVEKVMDWTGEQHGSEPFFYLQYRCALWYGDVIAGEGLGSCNSWEKKYRYRNAERVCPECGKATIFKSKPRPGDAPGTKYGYYCWQKKGGCGFQFPAGDPRIESQELGQVKNDNPADLVNTVDKMAQKRALVAATLIAVNASEFFTQDIEDMGFGDIIEGEIVEGDTTEEKKQPPKENPLLKEFDALGKKTYGDEWNDKRPALCLSVSKKRTNLSTRLNDDELQKLIDGMKAKANGGGVTPITVMVTTPESRAAQEPPPTDYAKAALFTDDEQSLNHYDAEHES